ncbi:AF1Q protein, partial [Polyodon spathula]|nr:protein AF1q [Polyodon spathula]XP_041095038.1 protein AF1q [Polyodon spathula]MBN3278946.1 AF1Q protein [Polyodon spathula]
MLDTINSQYDSFLFWRQPIPELDLLELEGLGLGGGTSLKGGQGGLKKKKESQNSGQDEDNLLEFNTFNYWRAPIASIEPLDFELL